MALKRATSKPREATASQRKRPRPRLVAAHEADASLGELPADLLLAALEQGSALYLADPNGRIPHANAAYRELAPHLTTHPEKAPATPAQIAAAEGGVLRLDHAVERDGETCPYVSEHRLAVEPDGAPRVIVGRVAPADEPARMRRALALARERLDDVARLSSDWLWETDRELAVTFVSPRVTEMLGFHPRELTGHNLIDLAANGGEELAELLGQQPPPAFRDQEVEIVHKQGGRRLFLVAGLPVFCPETGDFLGFRGTAQDVTELRAREQALYEAKDAAETANRAKSRFLANMSHELRTPLNAIIGFSEIMRAETLGEIGNVQYRDYAGDILDSARHLLALINDVLDVSRIEAGKLTLEEETVHPKRLVEQAARVVADGAEHAGITVETALPEETPLLHADGCKLTQVLLNLLSNSIKFTAGGGHVALSAEPAEDGSFIFRVSDDGIGMSEADIGVALTPFGQVDNRLARRFEGSGLGLPLSRALIEAHGGTLEVASAPQAGTTVTIALPAERVLRP